VYLACTATGSCGLGTRIRVRACDNPAPENGGKACRGKAFRTETCGIPCKNGKPYIHTNRIVTRH